MMKEHPKRWRERYAKVLKGCPELKEASNLFLLFHTWTILNKDEQKLQQRITAALICDNPYTYDKRNIMEYRLEVCNTPTDRVCYTDPPISWWRGFMLRYSRNETLYGLAVKCLEQIYFTL